MEVLAKSKYISLSPRKIGLVSELIVGLKVSDALEILKNINKKAARVLLLVIKQGVGNSVNNYKLEKKTLVVKRIEVNKGPIYKRGRPVSRGQWHEILKRTSHIKILIEGEVAKKAPPVKKGVRNGAKS